jgi:hypothetical protein
VKPTAHFRAAFGVLRHWHWLPIVAYTMAIETGSITA